MSTLHSSTGIQAPCTIGPVQIDNCAQVIVQSDINVQTACDPGNNQS